MITAVIIDDVEKARVALKSDIDDFCPQIEVIGEANGVGTGVAEIKDKSPDVVFLDIKMGDGSGFDLIEQLQNESQLNCQVIFTTAYDEYAIKAFKYSALDYLLKPVDPDDLVESVKKIEEKEPSYPNQDALNFLLENLKSNQPNNRTRLALSSTEKIQIVEIKDIVRCEASGNYTYFFLTNGKKVVVSKTMKEYNDLLGQHDFIRVHHSHLINLIHVKEFVKIDGTYLVLSNGNEVPVSVRKREVLMEKLNDLK